MKKNYYQTNILYQLFLFILFILFLIIQYFAVKIGILIFSSISSGENKYIIDRIVILLIFEVFALLILRVFLRLEHNNIHIKENIIYMNDDWARKKQKIQYATKVKINDIQAIDIIWSTKDSLLKNIPSGTFGNMLPKAYISFLTIDGKISNMLILYMNSKTIKTLIDDIKKLMIKYNNHNKIEKTDVLVKKYTSQIRFKRK